MALDLKLWRPLIDGLLIGEDIKDTIMRKVSIVSIY